MLAFSVMWLACSVAEVKVRRKSVRMTRREFVAAASMALAAGCNSRGESWETLSAQEARTLAAICDQIIPADDYPSASQAGVVTYIDHQLTRHYRRYRGTYESGLRQVEQISKEQSGFALAEGPAEQQRRVVTILEQRNRKFFEMVRSHTLEGYYGSPRHGGNRDAVSWRMLGLAEPPVRGRADYDFTAGSRS